jgi:hypothetical protein
MSLAIGGRRFSPPPPISPPPCSLPPYHIRHCYFRRPAAMSAARPPYSISYAATYFAIFADFSLRCPLIVIIYIAFLRHLITPLLMRPPLHYFAAAISPVSQSTIFMMPPLAQDYSPCRRFAAIPLFAIRFIISIFEAFILLSISAFVLISPIARHHAFIFAAIIFLSPFRHAIDFSMS